jgi:peroxin-2
MMHPLETLSTLVPASASSALGLERYDVARRQADAELRRRGKFAHLPEDECAICYENASTTTTTTLEDIGDATHVRAAHSQLRSSSDSRPTARDGRPPTHPLTTPYRTSCGHIYCYTCVAEKMLRAADEAGGPWECLRCGKPVLSAERFHVEKMYWASEGEEGSVEEWGSDYFDEIGSSSLSGMSAGSRGWVSGSDEERSE